LHRVQGLQAQLDAPVQRDGNQLLEGLGDAAAGQCQVVRGHAAHHQHQNARVDPGGLVDRLPGVGDAVLGGAVRAYPGEEAAPAQRRCPHSVLAQQPGCLVGPDLGHLVAPESDPLHSRVRAAAHGLGQ
jgi:hypothetical protein